MQPHKPLIDPTRITEDDPLLTTPNDPTSAGQGEPGETPWLVTVDGKEVQVMARDRAHLIAKLKKLYPGSRMETQQARQHFSGKRPNYNERVRLGGGTDISPPMNRRQAEKLNHRKQLAANKLKQKKGHKR
jgi:hypothetical protein